MSILRTALLSLVLLCLAALTSLSAPGQASAAAPRFFTLAAPVLETDGGDIRIALDISVDNEEGLGDMLKDGAIMELTITAVLERSRSFLPDADLSAVTLTSLVRHNPLTREYSLTMPGAGRAMVDKNLSRLLAATWRKLAFSLGDISLLHQAEPGSDYLITLDLSLRHTEVPPWLANAFIFWSWDVVEPVTLTLPFTF